MTWHEGKVYSIHRRLLVRGIQACLDFDVKQNTFTSFVSRQIAKLLGGRGGGGRVKLSTTSNKCAK